MTMRPVRDATKSDKYRLAALPARSAPLDRHPKDGWRLADPYPLGPRARTVFIALIDAICPSLPALASTDLRERVEVGARTLLRYMHPVVARGLWFGLFILDWLPLLTFGSAGRLHQLKPEVRSKFVARYAKSRFKALRLLVTGVRSLVLSVYFDQSDVHRAMRYAPTEFMRERMALRRSLLEPVTVAAE
jgi:hypothetical protein